MALGASLTNWLLNQLEFMPLDLLRNNALMGTQRILNMIYGDQEAEEVQALLRCADEQACQVATVFLPGVMGSLLASTQGLSSPIWLNPIILLNGQVGLLDLNDDGTDDRSPDVHIVPVGIEKLTYLKIILTLAQQTRLYEFPYDWRRHLEWNAHKLQQALQRWSRNDPERRFVLVGHSMGGMLARTYLALYPQEAERRIQRVVMIGSPLYGAALATLIFSGETAQTQLVARLHPNNDVVRLCANFPASYQLLPPPPELFPSGRPYPVNWDLYDARAWHLPHIRQDYLDDARRLHYLWAEADPQVEVVEIAGCHCETVTDVLFLLDEDAGVAERPHFTPVSQESGEDSGDDTVPLWSVRRPGITTYYCEGHHHLLPSQREVLEAVIRLVRGERPALPTELPAPSGLLERLAPISLWQQVTELRRRIERGQFSLEDLQKLRFTS